MRTRLSKKTIIVFLIVLLALFVAIMTVSAAELSSSDTALARADSYGYEGITTVPVAGTDHRLISPWGIDATSIKI